MKPLQNHRKRAEGFSLIELLVVFAILVVLVTMMFGFASGKHQRTQKELCRDNLQKIYLGLQIYANDFDGALPRNTNALTSEDVLDVLVPRYIADTSIFICPGGRDRQIPEGQSLRKYKISYAYYMGCRLDTPQNVLMSDRQIDELPKQTNEFIFSPAGHAPGNNHHQFGGNFLFCDGSTRTTPARLTFPLTVTPGAVLLNPKP